MLYMSQLWLVYAIAINAAFHQTLLEGVFIDACHAYIYVLYCFQ